MIKQAKVISQKPSAAKAGMYITTVNDGLGELRAYTPRKLDEGQIVVISIKSGAIRDPLSIEIFSQKKEAEWLSEHR